MNLPFTSCICSFLPPLRFPQNGVNFVLPSDRGAGSLHAERDGVIRGCAFVTVYGAAFDVVDGGILVTVDGVGFGD